MKTIFGVLLILLAIFISLCLLMATLPLVGSSLVQLKNSNGHSFGYIIGLLIGFTFFATINFAVYYLGYRMLSAKRRALKSFSREDFPPKF